jgi:hypothetical protein
MALELVLLTPEALKARVMVGGNVMGQVGEVARPSV